MSVMDGRKDGYVDLTGSLVSFAKGGGHVR